MKSATATIMIAIVAKSEKRRRLRFIKIVLVHALGGGLSVREPSFHNLDFLTTGTPRH